MRTVTSNLFRNVAPSPSLYASFIFPNQGTRQRGYITYTIAPRALLPEGYRQAGYSQMTYMHQKKRFLYPAETADSSSIFSINAFSRRAPRKFSVKRGTFLRRKKQTEYNT